MDAKKYLVYFGLPISGLVFLFIFLYWLAAPLVKDSSQANASNTDNALQAPKLLSPDLTPKPLPPKANLATTQQLSSEDLSHHKRKEANEKPVLPSVEESIRLSEERTRTYIEENNRRNANTPKLTEQERNEQRQQWEQEQQEKRPKHYRFRLDFPAEGAATLVHQNLYPGEVSVGRPITGQFLYVMYKAGVPSHVGTFVDPTLARSSGVQTQEATLIRFDSGSITLSAPLEALDDSSYLEFYRLDPQIPHDTVLDLSNVDWVINRSTLHSDMHLGDVLPQ